MSSSAEPVPEAERPLLDTWPALRARLPFAALGDWPTPTLPLDDVAAHVGRAAGELWVKRDDLSSPVYGGNKVRTLEVLMAAARARGATTIAATGAYGSNHAVATVLHAPRAGLDTAALLWPQPPTEAAKENLRVTLARCPRVVPVAHWSTFPLRAALFALGERRAGRNTDVMEPGGAVPLGALGYVNAALELAHQVRAGVLPEPKRVVIAIGSNCTTAGLLVGLHHASRLGIAFSDGVPELLSVRVTPWPITSRLRVLSLASAASELLAELAGDASLVLSRAQLGSRCYLDGSYIGAGYGEPTSDGVEAIRLWHEAGGHELDTGYSAKSAAAVLATLWRGAPGPVLFWSTKSSVPLPDVSAVQLTRAPAAMQRWLQLTHPAPQS